MALLDNRILFSMFHVTGFEFWARTVIFRMKYIVITKTFYRVMFPLRTNKSFCMRMFFHVLHNT